MTNEKYRILVTGACGSVGSAMVERFLGEGHTVCAFDHNENGLFKLDQNFKDKYRSQLRLFVGDIRDVDRLYKAFECVNIVYHCAALKHVYLSEYNPFEAMQTNIAGTNNVINAAVRANVDKVIYTSSDKAVNPTSTMGATKLLGERLITAANQHTGEHNTKFASVRFGNVLNTSGSVLSIFRGQIKNSQPLTITSKDMTRFFLSMSHALDLCVHAAGNMVGGEIFVKNMGCCSIMSLAKAVSRTSDFKYEIIGHKPGEKAYEELITQSEVERTVYSGSWYTILPDTLDSASLVAAEYRKCYGKLQHIDGPVTSDSNMLSDEEVYSMLNENGLV
jgi:UDP-N-acetylglucosamine 4,6-dehydratase/5-epimerase